LEKLRDTIEDAKEADSFRILGELLTASLHLAQRGDKSIEVINYYDEDQKPLEIELDPQLTPSENAQRYFKKYTKLRNSVSAVQEQIEAADIEITYLDTLLAQLDRATLGDIEGIRDELVEQGYLRDRGGKKGKAKKKKTDKPLLTCYTSGEGIPIYVGKNNIQNEYLTNRLAQPNDTWLHTKDIPGSHVVIRADTFGETTLHEAAMLAAYYSQAKSSSQVPVDFTLIRHVRKPNGSKPGYVIYERQKTLFVTPDDEAVKSMPVTVK
ncbi:MAG: fibronectin-binding protein, partial [Paenibacillus sp.]|nr:fibronectin-binding protein [Paenibacillus sp.]